MTRTILIAVSLFAIFAAGRAVTDSPAAAAPVDAPVALIDPQPQPLCLDLHYTNTRVLTCPGSNKKVVCTSQCTTHRHLDTSTQPATCVNGLTICTNEVCDYSNC